MADAIDTFRRIVGLLVKWVLICVVALVGIAGAIAAAFYGYYWFTYWRHAENISFLIWTDKCSDDKYPLLVMVENKSAKILERVDFKLEARRKGRSTDIALYHSYSDDQIIEPGKGRGQCWAAPLSATETDNPRSLEWTVGYKSFKFKD